MVVGVGRFGINVITEIMERQFDGITRTISVDTDSNALARSNANINIQLGDGSRSEGIRPFRPNSGSNPVKVLAEIFH